MFYFHFQGLLSTPSTDTHHLSSFKWCFPFKEACSFRATAWMHSAWHTVCLPSNYHHQFLLAQTIHLATSHSNSIFSWDMCPEEINESITSRKMEMLYLSLGIYMVLLKVMQINALCFIKPFCLTHMDTHQPQLVLTLDLLSLNCSAFFKSNTKPGKLWSVERLQFSRGYHISKKLYIYKSIIHFDAITMCLLLGLRDWCTWRMSWSIFVKQLNARSWQN